MAINDKLRSPVVIFFIYVFVSVIFIMVFRFIYPGSDTPLWIYSRTWRFLKGFQEVFDWFPALAFSALVVPFGFVSEEEEFQSFSDIFFKRLINSVLIAISAAVLYGLIFFLLLPMLKNKEEDLLYKGEMYQLAKTYAQERKSTGDWYEVSRFLAVCDIIWPGNMELNDLRAEVEVNLSKQRSEENLEKERARAALLREWRNADVSTFSGSQPLNAVQAISMSTEAFEEQRYFDAHWLATLAGRLAVAGSPEASNAARIASASWNLIASQEPNQMERRMYDIYHLKLSGYQAMNTGDWIRAFYIFQELLTITPDDPDASNFFAASERGAKEYAFFLDEMELSIGEILTGAVFSLLTENDGRVVVRFHRLTTSTDVAYGIGFEYMSFDEDARPVASTVSRYAKILPFTLNNNQQVLVLTHALDRDNEKNNFDSEWLLGNKTPGGIILDVSYDDLLLLSYVRYGLPNLQINELFLASDKLNDKGYVGQIFQAEILNRLGCVLFFLPVAIIVITIGWRFRVKTKPRYFFVLMLPVLPVVFHGFVFMYRSIINTLGIWLVLSFGFVPALAGFIVVLAFSMFISLITLAAQHS
jgi:hypothetical protein